MCGNRTHRFISPATGRVDFPLPAIFSENHRTVLLFLDDPPDRREWFHLQTPLFRTFIAAFRSAWNSIPHEMQRNLALFLDCSHASLHSWHAWLVYFGFTTYSVIPFFRQWWIIQSFTMPSEAFWTALLNPRLPRLIPCLDGAELVRKTVRSLLGDLT